MALIKMRPSKHSKTRKSKNTFTTKSGKTIKLHTSLADRIKASRDEKALRKAERLRGMPKSRIKRFFYRMHPKRLYKYWFSREGGIMALKITGIGIITLFVLMIGVFAYFRKDLPNLRDISGNNIGGSIRYYDKTGQTLLWEDFDAVKRIPVQGDQISNYLKQATIALEDRDFYKHGGFDTKGITRAAWANLTGGSTSQGGSTITQQLVKLSQKWTEDRSYTRKVKELILAVELERSYSKEEILTGYLNTAPYGNVQYGAQTAAQDYFKKDAKDLTLAEAVFMASIPQSPSYYSPYGAYFNEEFDGETGHEALVGRMHYTLNVMVEMGFIKSEEAEAAKQIDVLATVHKPESRYTGIRAPYYVLTAKEELEKKFGSETVLRSGWKVTTTLDLNLQQIAEEEVQKGINQVKKQRGDVAAFVAEDVETGQIVAMVGGPDFTNPEYGENNYARTPLPPGSSFKPYDYSALIENTNNVGAGTVLYDTRGPLPGYPCNGGDDTCLRDYDRKYPGPVTVRYALGGSRNVPAVKAMLIAGVDKTIETAEQLMNATNPDSYGYACYPPGTTDFIAENEDQCYASSAIGDGAYLKMDEHVHGLASISRGGLNIPRTYILKIQDANDKTTYEWKLEGGTQVLRPDTAYIMADMMSDPRASYMATKSHRMPGAGGTWRLALKTGTTNDSKDGWMTGFTTKYAAATWVGYHNRQVELTGFMETMTRPIVANWMQRVHKDLPVEDWVKPAGVQTLPAYVVRSHVGSSSIEPSPNDDLYPSWYQKKSNNQKITLDKISNKLATECTPDRAKQEEAGGSASAHSGDTFAGGGANTDEKDDVHKCTDVKPSVTSISTAPGSGNAYVFSVNVQQGTHPLAGNGDKGGGKLEFMVNGQVVGTQDLSGASSYDFGYTPAAGGDQAVSARVIDSVLYEGTSNSVTIHVISLDNAARVGNTNNVSFSWTNASGSVSIFRSTGGGAVCSGVGSCMGVNALSGGSTFYAKETPNGDSSVVVTVN